MPTTIPDVEDGDTLLEAWGDAVRIAIAELQAYSVLTTRGQLIVQGASAPAALAKGASGTFLKAGATDPAYAAVDFADLTNYGSTAWTPGLAFGGNSVGMTYTVQTGIWKKLGAAGLILATFSIILSAKGSSTGAATLTGLPVTATNVNHSGGVAVTAASGFTGLTGPLGGRVLNNGTTVNLQQWSASGMANITETPFGATARLDGMIIYPT